MQGSPQNLGPNVARVPSGSVRNCPRMPRGLGTWRARDEGLRTADLARVSRIERGIGASTVRRRPDIPTLARVLGVAPLVLFDVDPDAPSFTALRMAAGLTLQALSEATAISYT